MADSTEALEDKMPGLSQTDCLAGKGSEGDRGPCAACQSAKYVSNWVSAVQADANLLLLLWCIQTKISLTSNLTAAILSFFCTGFLLFSSSSSLDGSLRPVL